MSDTFHFDFVEPQRTCSYLPAEKASLEYRVYPQLAADSYGVLLERGWRRHGRMLFRPQCPTCRQCRGLRVPVATFLPSKSQRRTRGKNSDITVRLASATVSPAHVALYNVYNADMATRRGWPGTPTSPDEYHSAFLTGEFPFAWELQYFRGQELVGVGLVDLLPRALSSVYFYHDPAWRPFSPGVFSVMCEFDLCRERGIPYLYLGYWIEQCPSMAYKNTYGPHELLEEYVEEDEVPEWEPT